MERMVIMVVMMVSLFISPNYVLAFPFPDTGQTECYNIDLDGQIQCPQPGSEFYGQDAQYAGLARSYTKLGNGGVELPDTATQASGWIMTRDNVTNRIWEIKTNANKNDKYNWNNAQNVFIAQMNQQNHGGFSDWRLPTARELASLVNFSIPYPGPTIDTDWFPLTGADYYWTSTPWGTSTNSVFTVYFAGASISNKPISDTYYVRAVRGSQFDRKALSDNGDGTVTDPNTGLMWQKENPFKKQIMWQQALAYAEDLELAGYPDWRLPDINELQTLVDYSRYYPAIDPLLADDTEGKYWSSTTYPLYSNRAFCVTFYYGNVMDSIKDDFYESNLSYVRAVRGKQVKNDLSDQEKANILFNWVESILPDLFPSGPENQTLNGIIYRYYSQTNVYLATYVGDLYYIDQILEVFNIGSVDYWLSVING